MCAPVPPASHNVRSLLEDAKAEADRRCAHDDHATNAIVAGIETVFAGQVTPQPHAITHTDYRQPGPITLQKGDELGRFMLGSTAIVIFAEGAARFDPALNATCAVRMGQSLGAAG